MSLRTIDVSNSRLSLSFAAEDNRLRWANLSPAGGAPWLSVEAPSSLFSVTIDGRVWEAPTLTLTGVDEDEPGPGIRHTAFHFNGPSFAVTAHVKIYAEGAVLEAWQDVRNESAAPIRIASSNSIDLIVSATTAELFSYTGNWGSEYEPQHRQLEGAVRIESRKGRSSKGDHPWFALTTADGRVLSGSVAWSGNWVFRFEPQPGGAYRLTGGLNDWEFYKDLAPGATFSNAPVMLVVGPTLNAVSQDYARVGRKHWYPHTTLSDKAPVEWNHWWPYEDAEINEDVFRANVEKAKPMGFEVCTLDAGWFGPSDAGTFWEHYRGDWDVVNGDRFPSGIGALGEHVHAHGMRFGVWCEIEGLGEKAQVAIDHPEYVALRDGKRLGYVCFGNPAVQEWAYQTLAHIITDFGADWIKLDSNFDPEAGCNRTDHGHGAGDGLYEHIAGYYKVIERIHKDFPEVVPQNCSSGGLRIDLGMMQRTAMTFLSDPDWAVHDLQIFWGASTMLAPNTLLHWTYSQWRNTNPPPYQTFDPHDPKLTRKIWDYYCRISMLGLFGLSQRLPTMPTWMAERSVEHIVIYKDHVRKFVKEADLYRLTDQPLRSGAGERWPAFQYSLPDKSQHLLFVFRMPGAGPEGRIRLQELEPERVYTISGFEGETGLRRTGRELMTDGLVFKALLEEDSALLKIA